MTIPAGLENNRTAGPYRAHSRLVFCQFVPAIPMIMNASSRLHRILPLCLVFPLTPMAAAEPAGPEPLKVLMVTGGCCHDYNNQKDLLAAGLGARINAAFTVVHEGGDSRDHKISIFADPDWAKPYDVVLHNVCFGALEDDAFLEAMTQPHHDGLPAVMLHCSAHSYRAASTDAWRKTVGISSYRHEKQRELKVETVAAEHPVMKGFPSVWDAPSDELYIVEKEWPGLVPLAKSHGQETRKDHTVIWTNTHGSGNIFGTTLGHANHTIAHPVYLDLIARGLLWVTGHLLDDGTPAAGYGPPAASGE